MARSGPSNPCYIQFVFAFDRVKALVAEHQEWRTRQPFQAVLEGNVKALVALGERGLREIITATHSGMTTDQFSTIVADWLATAKDVRFKRLYTKLVYQPMLELRPTVCLTTASRLADDVPPVRRNRMER